MASLLQVGRIADLTPSTSRPAPRIAEYTPVPGHLEIAAQLADIRGAVADLAATVERQEQQIARLLRLMNAG